MKLPPVGLEEEQLGLEEEELGSAKRYNNAHVHVRAVTELLRFNRVAAPPLNPKDLH